MAIVPHAVQYNQCPSMGNSIVPMRVSLFLHQTRTTGQTLLGIELHLDVERLIEVERRERDRERWIQREIDSKKDKERETTSVNGFTPLKAGVTVFCSIYLNRHLLS